MYKLFFKCETENFVLRISLAANKTASKTFLFCSNLMANTERKAILYSFFAGLKLLFLSAKLFSNNFLIFCFQLLVIFLSFNLSFLANKKIYFKLYYYVYWQNMLKRLTRDFFILIYYVNKIIKLYTISFSVVLSLTFSTTAFLRNDWVVLKYKDEGGNVTSAVYGLWDGGLSDLNCPETPIDICC